jgi:hypothetical protein
VVARRHDRNEADMYHQQQPARAGKEGRSRRLCMSSSARTIEVHKKVVASELSKGIAKRERGGGGRRRRRSREMREPSLSFTCTCTCTPAQQTKAKDAREDCVVGDRNASRCLDRRAVRGEVLLCAAMRICSCRVSGLEGSCAWTHSGPSH